MSERIVINPEICNGRPVVRGTRITARGLVTLVKAGANVPALPCYLLGRVHHSL